MRLPELLRDFRPVDPASERVLKPWLLRWNRRLPRFFLSPSYLGAQTAVYRWGVVEDCMVLLKVRQFMGRPAALAVVPPWRTADPWSLPREEAACRVLREAGVGIKVSPEDCRRLGIAEPEWDRGQAEYVYGAAVHARPSGRAHSNTRSARNTLRRLVEAGVLHRVNEIDSRAGLDELARRWHAQTGRHRDEWRTVARWREGDGVPRGLNAWAVDDGTVVLASLTEQVGPGHVVVVARLHDYERCPVPDAALTLHQADCELWHDVLGPDTLLTSGAALAVPGLTAHKQKLRPVAVQPVGTWRSPAPITMDEYRQIRGRP